MRIQPEHDKLAIVFEGWEKIWALKHSLEIPAGAISSVEYTADMPRKAGRWPVIRMPGTVIPGIFLAGIYLWRGERDFWYLHIKRPGVLIIKCYPRHYLYDTICVSCTEVFGHEALYWWRARKKS